MICADPVSPCSADAFADMASKIESSLSNKSSSEANTTQAAAPTAVDRRRAYEERKTSRAERIERIRELRNSYAAYLIQLFVTIMSEAPQGGWAFVEKCYPPTKEEDEASGQLVFVHAASETHWAGLNEDGTPRNPEEEDVPVAPKVMLLQGPKPWKADANGRRDPNPKDMPDGQTVISIMREALAKRGYGVQLVLSKGMINVAVIWNHDAWKAMNEEAQKLRAERLAEKARAAEQPADKTLSLDEYKAMKAKKQAQAPEEEEWQEAKPRRKAAAASAAE